MEVQQKKFQEKMIEMMNQQKEIENENVIDVDAETIEGQYDENTPLDIKLWCMICSVNLCYCQWKKNLKI